MKKTVKCGLGYIVDTQWQPKLMTERQAKREATRIAKKQYPKGFWSGMVADCGTHYRVNIAGQKR